MLGCSSEDTYSPEQNTAVNETGQNPSLARLRDNVVSGGPGKDGIPPIDEPKFVPAREMDDLLKPEDRVFVLDYGGEMVVTRVGSSETESFEGGNPYLAELEDFTAAIRDGRDPEVGPEEILGNARALGVLLESARQGGRPQSL